MARRRRIEEEGVGDEVAAQCHPAFVGQHGSEQRQRREDRARLPASASPAVVHQESDDAEEYGDHGVTIGDPEDRKGQVVIDGVEESRQPRNRRSWQDSPVEGEQRDDQADVPEHGVEVRPERAVRPESVIERMGEARQRSVEGEAQLRIGPPGQDPGVDQTPHLCRITVHEDEETCGRTVLQGKIRVGGERRPVKMVVRDPAATQSGREQSDADQGQDPEPVTAAHDSSEPTDELPSLGSGHRTSSRSAMMRYSPPGGKRADARRIPLSPGLVASLVLFLLSPAASSQCSSGRFATSSIGS
ncbi:MAG: hypothetical protein AMS25_14370 [Gemmatimonas sp. SM23_52]|nr:MAG: hypothetical protein AMS25_14370 [Gemmatimonas sp. SM23_52]